MLFSQEILALTNQIFAIPRVNMTLLFPISRGMRRFRFVILLVGIASSGCADWNPRGPGSSTIDAAWDQGRRPTSPAGGAFGFDSRAREIERSLGVQ